MTPKPAPDLSDLLEQPTAQEVKHTPTTTFDGTTGTLTTGPLKTAPADYDALLVQFGYDPEEVEIIGHPTVSRWQQRARDKVTGDFETVWLAAYKFQIRSRTAGTAALDDLLAELSTWTPPAKPRKRKKSGINHDAAFVVQVGDMQWGKGEGDGSEGIARRWTETIDRAAEAYARHAKRHGHSEILLALVGDCIEGNQSQGGTLPLDLTITEQIRVYRRALLHAVRVLAPLTHKLTLAVVNGNHDEAARGDRATRIDDGWATEGAIALSDALALTPGFDHVAVQVPPVAQGYMTIKAGSSVFTLAHGHQWRKGKAAEWWANHAYYGGAPAAATHLLHGHWHSTSITVDGPRSILCSSTLDGGSPWYRERAGAETRTGGLCFTTIGDSFHNLEMI